jgi:Tfp pilus assembly protein PilZ
VSGVAKDISVGGMFVECPEVLPFGTELVVVGQLPGAPGALRLPGVVRWAKPGGLGVQFGLLGARETHAIARLLRPRGATVTGP